MPRAKKMKFVLSEEVRNSLETIDSELKKRGAKDYDLCQIFEDFFRSRDSKEVIDRFVDKNTPEDYKLSQLLAEPEEREKILIKSW